MDGPDGPGLEDPAGAWRDDALPTDIARMKRIPTIVAILRQFDRVSYLLSVGDDASSAVQALYVLASPYLKRVDGWIQKWDERQCAAVVGDDGRAIPVPTPGDIATWFELIMDGLTDAKVLFQEVRLSYVGDRKERQATNDEGPQLPLGPPGLERTPMGTRTWPAPAGHLGPRLRHDHHLARGTPHAPRQPPPSPQMGLGASTTPYEPTAPMTAGEGLGARLMRLRPTARPPAPSHSATNPAWVTPV